MLLGGAGDDVLAGLKGNDTLDGGAGNDLAVFDGSFSDYVISRVSATEIRLTHIDPYSFDTDFSTLVRGVENFLFQGSGSMMLAEVTAGPLGTSGNDTLIGTAGGDKLDGSSGNDSIIGLMGDDSLFGGLGNDTLDGGAGNDKLIGGAGNDLLIGGAGYNYFDGGAGNDTMLGGEEGGGTYVVDSIGDSVVVPVKNDYNNVVDVWLGSGTYVLPENVNMAFVMSDGAVSLVGNGLDNTLVGNSTATQIVGGAGDDAIYSYGGNDTVIGGTGADSFHFWSTAELSTTDTILDFSSAEGDKIVLLSAEFSALGSRGSTVDLSGPYLNYNIYSGALTYDADGAGGGAAVTIAILGSAGARPWLTSADIEVF